MGGGAHHGVVVDGPALFFTPVKRWCHPAWHLHANQIGESECGVVWGAPTAALNKQPNPSCQCLPPACPPSRLAGPAGSWSCMELRTCPGIGQGGARGRQPSASREVEGEQGSGQEGPQEPAELFPASRGLISGAQRLSEQTRGTGSPLLQPRLPCTPAPCPK